ncbi:hypothetical protein [Streptomyces sp. HUAS TT20]|uniref:hypothetical protein n=1 Tax=Streptomyces sp. HUAS TT20 TaxID=3447509 RepID=UPI0021DB5E7B|nr:hypothetical protein [Streptomyces sp. HUAS 15-9]UXY32932.1 hypothetical protein N8I87_39990 [Streptomyces sp. HUAS 15-9]
MSKPDQSLFTARAHRPHRRPKDVLTMALFLFLILVAIVLGLIGAVAEGLTYLLIIGIVVFVADLVLFGRRWSRRSHRHLLR